MRRWVKTLLITIAVFLALIFVVPLLIPVPPMEGLVSAESLADPDSKFVKVNGLNVHYKEAGSGELTIILLHGFGASTYSWREVMQPLAAGSRVIAFDRPAFGLTERPMPGDWRGDNPYSPSAQVELLVGLMDQLGVQKVLLVGNSAGGTVALSTALKYPERVSGLVLVDAAIYEGGGSPTWMRPLILTPQADHLGPLFVRRIQSWGVDFLKSAWHNPALIQPEVMEEYKKPLKIQNWDRALWEMTKASRSSDLAARLTEIKIPVLVVTGDDDRIVATENSVRLSKEIPGAQFVMFNQCGHVPQEECPQQFLAAVEPFAAQFRK